MTFKSLPLTVREVKATEAVLERLYNSARLGLKGDALALNAGLLPVEFRRLCQLDPIADMAVQKGWADTEANMARVIQDAAASGDAKVALDYLKHRSDWVAKQQVQVDVAQQISVSVALEQANQRVIEVISDAGSNLQLSGRDGADDALVVAADQGRPRGLRRLGVSLGGSEHAAGEPQGAAQMAARDPERDPRPHQG